MRLQLITSKGQKMKILDSFKLIGVAAILTAGLSACDKPGPAERAGQNIDRSVDQVGEKMSDTADRVGDKMSSQGEKAGVAIDDTEITAKIKAAIFAEPGLKTLQISVDTIHGVVTLTGSVSSKADKDNAQALASAVSGVKDVNNRLEVMRKK
jgi:hypothetical protein